MTKKKKLISHAASVLPVDDVNATAAYYRDMLGFDIAFQWGENYAIVRREEAAQIHFTKRQDGAKPSATHTAIYIFSQDVDALHQEFLEKSIPISNPIGNREYGMRDFDLIDCNGYILCFGMNIGYYSG